MAYHSDWHGHVLEYGQHDRYGKATYRDITGPDGHLANLRPFKGNSMKAAYNYDGNYYVVFSYETVIAEYNLTTGEKWFNEEKYSHTTSRHQSATRAWLAHNREDYVDVEIANAGTIKDGTVTWER